MAAEVDIHRCTACKPGRSIKLSSESLKDFKKTLPAGYEYALCEFVSEGEQFKVDLKLRMTTEKEAREWLKLYQASSRTTLRTRSTYPRDGKKRRKLACRLDRCCQHNTRIKTSEPLPRRTKYTDCPATLSIRVKQITYKKGTTIRESRSSDCHIPEWPTSITFTGAHNHGLDDPQILKYRDVSVSVKEKFITLFQEGHSASSALKQHKEDLAKEHGEKYETIVSDRHYCPDLQFCYRLYYNIYRKKTKCISKKKMNKLIQEKIESYNNENGDCILSRLVDGELVIAIVTPFMKRVHSTVASAGEVVFMDHSTGDSGSSQLFMMMTDSWAGGLPVGCFITRSDSTQAITAGLQMVQELVGEASFYGRGQNGPQLFLTDNLEPERAAILSVYPSAEQLLCIFHVLRSFWQFLFDSQSKIDLQDKVHLFQLMKTLLNSTSETDMQLHFNSIQSDAVVCKYENVFNHFVEIFGQRQLWALCYLDLQELSLTGNTANNFLDAAMMVLKDRILKKYHVVQTLQILDLITTKLETLFRTRMEDLAEGQVTKALNRRYVSIYSLSSFKRDSITENSPHTFILDDKKGTHTVDMNVGLCTCAAGISGGPCKHQCILIKLFDIEKWKFSSPPDEISKKELLYLARGDVLADLDGFVERLKEALTRDPATIKKPLTSFLHQSSRCKSDGDLAKALLSFKLPSVSSIVVVETKKKRQATQPLESERKKAARLEEARMEEPTDEEVSSLDTDSKILLALQRSQETASVPANGHSDSDGIAVTTICVNVDVSEVVPDAVPHIQEVTLPHESEAEGSISTIIKE